MTVHLEKDGKPLSMLLDVVEVTKVRTRTLFIDRHPNHAQSHLGVNLAAAFADILQDFRIAHKILSIVCDNALLNDAMIDELEKLLEDFAGDLSRIQCFLHIVNLVAKSMLKQFDVPKKKGDGGGETENDRLDDVLRRLVEGIEIEEEISLEEDETERGDDEVDEDDEWVDELERLSVHKRNAAYGQIQPIQFVLVKVQQFPDCSEHSLSSHQLRKLAFKIIHSTTIVLPAWHEILKELKLESRIMPRDVSTRWNSTFNMLDFALKYHIAIDKTTADRKTNSRMFELNDGEWEIACQLHDTLKVCPFLSFLLIF
jgi:hypothetical protein